MAVIEQRECDVCGTRRNVEGYRFEFSQTTEDGPPNVDMERAPDLCPKCRKRFVGFALRGLHAPGEVPVVAEEELPRTDVYAAPAPCPANQSAR
jgi:hypothetical protein